MSNEELSPEELAEVERIAAEVVREAARVGVDWDAAAERMRALATQEWVALEDGATVEVTMDLDMTALLATLRRLPDGAGTERFLAAFEAEDTSR